MVCSRLEKIQRDFLWGGNNLEWKPHIVNWKTMYSEKKRGGWFKGEKPFQAESSLALQVELVIC